MLAILHLLAMFVADLFKSRRRLEAKNLFLRHQLNIALRRAPPRGRPESAHAIADGLVQTIDFPLVIVRGGVLLILVVERVLIVSPIGSRCKASADRIFFGRRLRRIRSPQVIGQQIRRRVRFHIRRFAPSSGLVSHGPTPSYL
jgi:hypothetical protein